MSVTPTTLTQRKRAAILFACIREFGERGFAGARIDRIAERAGVSKRTMYKHFPSKEAMFDAIVADAAMPLPPNAAPEYDPAQAIGDQLIEVVSLYMGVIGSDDYVTTSRILVAEFIADPVRSAGAAPRDDVANGPIEAMIAHAMQSGVLRQSDPAYAATQLTGMLKTFFFWPRFLAGAPAVETHAAQAIIADSVAMFLSHYGVAAEAGR